MSRRTPIILGGLVLALFVGLGYWHSERQAAARRLDAWRLKQQDDAARQRLEQPIELAGGPMALDEFTRLVEEATGLPVSVDLDAAAPPATPPSVVLPRGTFTVRSALRLALGPKSLWASVDRHGIAITSIDAAPDLTRLRTEVYPLPQPEPAGMNEESWENLLLYNVQPHTWDYVGGRCHVEAVPGALVVVQSEEGHRQVRELMKLIERLDRADPEQPVALTPRGEGAVESLILSQLDEPASCELVATPLYEAIGTLMERHGIPYLLSHRLQEAGVDPATPITKSLRDISLRSLLQLLLSDLELSWTVQNEVLLISTPEDTEIRLRHVAYPVGDLVETSYEPDFDRLIELITTTLFPESWDYVGGPASVRRFGEDRLIVSQTEFVQWHVERFFEQLRRMLSADDTSRVAPIMPPKAAEQKLRAALQRPLEIEFSAMPLRDACQFVALMLDVPILLDTRRLEEAGVGSDTPVTLSLPAGPAGVQLQILLKQLELVLVIRDEVLLVTIPEEAETRLETRIYDTRALIGTLLGQHRLEDLIRNVAGPEAWDEVGGPGVILPYRGLLVISQLQHVHEQIERLLAALEEHCLEQSKVAGSEQRVVTIDPDSDRLVRTVTDDDGGRRPLELSARELLSRQATVNFDKTPLMHAMQRLAFELDFPFVIDEQTLARDLGGKPLPAVTVQADGLPLGGVLERILLPHEMDFAIRGGVVWISSAERLSWQRHVRLYCACDLAASETGGIRTLQTRIAAVFPELQPDSGGWRRPRIWTIEPGWFALLADRRLHEQFEDWLDEQRTGVKPERAVERERLEAQLYGLPEENQP